MYYRFRSSKKGKNKNYLIQLGDRVVQWIFEWESIGRLGSDVDIEIGFQLVKKYQIKELYWEKNITSGTLKSRTRVCENLNNIEADIRYKGNNNKIQDKNKIKKEIFQLNIFENMGSHPLLQIMLMTPDSLFIMKK
jgi:hypothetical protein